MHIITRLLLLAGLCLSSAQGFAQEAPMFGGGARTADQQATDRAYVEEALKHGTADDAAGELVTESWYAIDDGDLDTAMFRLNRAWLLQPDRPDIHWGFAIVSHLLGAPIEEVEKHFATAEASKAGDADFQASHGRVLFDHEKFREATLFFMKALQIDPENKTAHMGMWYSAEALGDAATAEKHRKLYEE